MPRDGDDGDAIRRLRDPASESLRVRWCDNANLVRAKAVHLPSFLAARADASDEEILATLGRSVTVSQAQMAIPVVADEVVAAAGLPPVHDILLRPDWRTLTEIPHSAGHLWVDVDMVDGDEPWGHCPRWFLRRMEEAATAHGLRMAAGVELEFHLLRRRDHPTAPPEPADNTPFALDAGFDVHHETISAILASLGGQGIGVAQHHPESGPGQYEISLEPSTPLAMADRVISARETIRAVAHRAGLLATFVPVLSETGATSSMHVHLSLTGDPTDGLGPHGDAFMAGILDHLVPLLAATGPTPGSYRRFRPHAWVGAFAGWGVGNKEVPLRVVPAATGGIRDVEVKAVDGTANPYIALGCLLAAGLDGVERALVLPEALAIDPADLSAAERYAAGVVALPQEPTESRRAFASSALFGSVMGDLHRSYTAVKTVEQSQLQALGPEGEVALLLDRY